jgi:hypothetical protein
MCSLWSSDFDCLCPLCAAQHAVANRIRKTVEAAEAAAVAAAAAAAEEKVKAGLPKEHRRGQDRAPSVALSVCITVHPLCIRFTTIFGASISEATTRPNPRSRPSAASPSTASASSGAGQGVGGAADASGAAGAPPRLEDLATRGLRPSSPKQSQTVNSRSGSLREAIGL